MIILPDGPLKQLWVDRAAVAEGRPAWVVRLPLVGVEYKASKFAIMGFVLSAGSKAQPLTPKGPAMWLETCGELRLET